jgi:hypothetical protein
MLITLQPSTGERITFHGECIFSHTIRTGTAIARVSGYKTHIDEGSFILYTQLESKDVQTTEVIKFNNFSEFLSNTDDIQPLGAVLQ